MLLQQSVMDGLREWMPEQGTPQGSVISPMLANVYLHPVDLALKQVGFEMVRYADDLVVPRNRSGASKASKSELTTSLRSFPGGDERAKRSMAGLEASKNSAQSGTGKRLSVLNDAPESQKGIHAANPTESPMSSDRVSASEIDERAAEQKNCIIAPGEDSW
jgi:hypothetical protein